MVNAVSVYITFSPVMSLLAGASRVGQWEDALVRNQVLTGLYEVLQGGQGTSLGHSQHRCRGCLLFRLFYPLTGFQRFMLWVILNHNVYHFLLHYICDTAQHEIVLYLYLCKGRTRLCSKTQCIVADCF